MDAGRGPVCAISAGAGEKAARITAAMLELAGVVADAAGWLTAERREVLGHLERSIDGLAAVRAVVLVAERESGAWQGSGDRSFEAWRGRTSRAGHRSATVQVRQAEQLETVPAVAAAVTDGRIGLEHAAIIAKVAGTGTLAQRHAAQSRGGQEHLLGLAERLDAGTFATTTARWAATVDPAGLERDHQGQRAARYLHVVDTARGTVVRGQLDSMAGHRLTLALEAVTPKPAADDDRDPGQRRADALDTIATGVLACADTKPGAHVPPHVSLILTEQTWLAAQAERDRQRRSRATFGFGATDEDATHGPGTDEDAAVGPGTGDEPWTVETVAAGYLPATLEDGTPVPVSELAAVMCECDLTRVVIDADGIPLDLGRTERVFTGVHRRAVIARDRECAWPHCHAHARWCQVHHIDWWERDAGPTSVDNGVLLCSFHHHEVHRRDLTITRLSPQARAGAPSRQRDHGTMARVRYEFRDPTGHAIGAPPRTSPPRTSPPRVAPPQRSAPSTPSPPRAAPPQLSGPPDELDLTPTTDPHTGMTVPAFLIA